MAFDHPVDFYKYKKYHRKATFLANRNGISMSAALSQADSDIPVTAEEVEKWQRQQIEHQSRRVANSGIFCLTTVCDNFIMWTHYAKEHTRICVQFHVRGVEEESHLDFIAAAQAVDYADRCPLITIVRDGSADIVRKAFLTKATPFRDEHEWRTVKYDQDPGLKPIPKGIIGAVILGCRIEPAARERVINTVLNTMEALRLYKPFLIPIHTGLGCSLKKLCNKKDAPERGKTRVGSLHSATSAPRPLIRNVIWLDFTHFNN